ncbi:hypothetical protein ME796_16730 [Lactobacillus delbrueckii]|uniref:hypothetical protein n=1 Tax=Lactobacillus delbrueckii TaxID=1584 RepID=UPI001F201D40|nr:hypothetical protein [Lactobacillus delbrueckii]GHN19316.1 hypothetical protein ME783_18580 [Lactobacillus delbrueckii]GHN42324.1 hypothetical protein ME796_16730 [Lactobacillus delbrueckii]
MINWNVTYKVEAAERHFAKLTNPMDTSKIVLPDHWNEVRKMILREWNDACEESRFNSSYNYEFDVVFGIKLYQLLNEKIGFTNRVASDDNVWRSLSLKVVPDLVIKRYGLKPEHFYKMSKRIWLKNIWWYIRLAWEGNAEETKRLLSKYSTDTILQLVERSGLGYYVSVDHEILKKLGNIEDRSNLRSVLRSVLKLNTAWLATTSPELYEGGVQGYVADLFDVVYREKDENDDILRELFK